MEETARPDPAQLQQSFTRLAGLLRQPDARQRLRSDPAEFLRSNDVQGLPEAAVNALTSLSPQELELFSKVQGRLADVPNDVPGGSEVCIIF